MFLAKFVEKIETRVLGLIIYFSQNHAIYEIMWLIIWCMHIAWWIPKAKNTYSEYVYTCIIASSLQQWLHKRASKLRSTYIAWLVELMHMPVYIRSYTHFIVGMKLNRVIMRFYSLKTICSGLGPANVDNRTLVFWRCFGLEYTPLPGDVPFPTSFVLSASAAENELPSF
jgi:hypothetical protein